MISLAELCLLPEIAQVVFHTFYHRSDLMYAFLSIQPPDFFERCLNVLREIPVLCCLVDFSMPPVLLRRICQCTFHACLLLCFQVLGQFVHAALLRCACLRYVFSMTLKLLSHADLMHTSAAAAAAVRASPPPSPPLLPNVLPGDDATADGTEAVAELLAAGAAGRGGASPSVRP